MRKVGFVLTFSIIFILFNGTGVTLAFEKTQTERLSTIIEGLNINLDNKKRTTAIQLKSERLIYKEYVVSKDDTIADIAARLDIAEDKIKNWNNINEEELQNGQELKLFLNNNKIEELQTLEAPKTMIKNTHTNNDKQNKEMDEKKKQHKVRKTLTVTATAYTAECHGCTGITYTGVDLHANRNAKVIAVDPNVISLGTKVYVEGYGNAIAADIGGAIKGNRIDIHLPTKNEALKWGKRKVEVTIMEEE